MSDGEQGILDDVLHALAATHNLYVTDLNPSEGASPGESWMLDNSREIEALQLYMRGNGEEAHRESKREHIDTSDPDPKNWRVRDEQIPVAARDISRFMSPDQMRRFARVLQNYAESWESA